MKPTLVLWDIDGTILRGDGIGKRAMQAALNEVLQLGATTVDLAGVPFHGNTDPLIIAAGLEQLGHDPSARLIAEVAASYLAFLEAEVACASPFRRLPGVLEVVDALAAAGAHQGLGTGNIEAAAWLKVGAVELGGRFAYGGFGSDAGERAELLSVGRERGAAQLGQAAHACRVVVIGDTLRDIAAARAIGARVIAVATGGDTLAALEAARPDALFSSLAAPDTAVVIADLVSS